MKNEFKLICFDLNKTLVAENSWLILNAALGITPEEDAIMHEQYKSGQISYLEWQSLIEAQYKKSPIADKTNIAKILNNYTYLLGAKDLIKYLSEKGYPICLISGAPDILVAHIAAELNIKYWFSNNTFIFAEDGRFDHIDVIEDEVQMKVTSLTKLCQELQIDPTECVCIGDGDNELEIFNLTKHGITFPSSKIIKQAWKVIDGLADLQKIL